MQSLSSRSELDFQLVALRIMFVSLLLVLVVLLIHRNAPPGERYQVDAQSRVESVQSQVAYPEVSISAEQP